MERSLAGMLFLVSAIAFSIAGGAWWMQRIVFTPDGTTDTTAAILEDNDIRQELIGVFSAISAPTLATTAPELGTLLEDIVMTSRPGATAMAPIVEQIHILIIGNSDEPVVVTGSQLIPVVRDERVAEIADITLPIETIGTLKTTKTVLGWMIPIAAGIGLLTMLAGILTRPGRKDILRGLGELGVGLAISILLFGYAIPVHMITAIDNRTWTQAIPQLASRTLPVVLGAAAVFGLAGVALIMASSSGGRKRGQSVPLSATRYRGGDNPGWS